MSAGIDSVAQAAPIAEKFRQSGHERMENCGLFPGSAA
jgi:hypothetical protein